jgi:hypothetical protein
MERLFSLAGKNYIWLLLPTGVAAVIAGILLVRAEEHGNWYTAQACLVTTLLLSALMVCVWWQSNHETPRLSDEAQIYNRAIHKLLLFAAFGFFALVLNGTRWELWQNGVVAKAIGYGSLVAGAFFVLGVLLGYLFGLRPTGPSQNSGEKSPGLHPNPPHTNLEEVADWFTKLILGAGLVELTSMRGPLGEFASFMASGVDPSPPADNGYRSSPAVALAIMLFFSASGILYGYLWTRYELAAKNPPGTETSLSADGSPVEPIDNSK